MSLYPSTAPASSPGAPIDSVVPVSKGGTGAATRQAALSNLGAIDVASIDTVGGPASLNAQGKLKGDVPPVVLSYDITLDGPANIPPNGTGVYRITNFHSLFNYAVTVTGASSFVFNDDTITITAGASGTITLVISGKSYSIVVGGARPERPQILTPLNGAVDQPRTITIATAAFAMPSGSTDTHLNSRWQWGTDPTFSTTIGDTTSTTDKTQFVVPNLPYSTNILFRVLHTGTSSGASQWSNPIEVRIRNDPSGSIDPMDGPSDGDKPNATDPYTTETPTWSYAGLVADSAKALVADQLVGPTTGSFSPYSAAAGNGSRFFFSIAGLLTPITYVNSAGVLAIEGTESGINVTGSTIVNNDSASTSAIDTLMKVDFTGRYLALQGRTADFRGVFIAKRTGSAWAQTAAILDNQTIANSGFGLSFAFNYNASLLVVGDPKAAGSTGRVYVYARRAAPSEAWDLVATLLDANGQPGDLFGTSVDIAGNSSRIVIGAPGAAGNLGKAYTFRRTGTYWVLEQELAPITASITNAAFGSKVAISGLGNTILVRRRRHTVSATLVADVSVFSWDGEKYVGKLEASPPVDSGTGTDDTRVYFGRHLKLSGDGKVALIAYSGSTGVSGADDLQVVPDAVRGVYPYNYAAGNWTAQTRVGGIENRFYFGSSLATDATTSVVAGVSRTSGNVHGIEVKRRF